MDDLIIPTEVIFSVVTNMDPAVYVFYMLQKNAVLSDLMKLVIDSKNNGVDHIDGTKFYHYHTLLEKNETVEAFYRKHANPSYYVLKYFTIVAEFPQSVMDKEKKNNAMDIVDRMNEKSVAGNKRLADSLAIAINEADRIKKKRSNACKYVLSSFFKTPSDLDIKAAESWVNVDSALESSTNRYSERKDLQSLLPETELGTWAIQMLIKSINTFKFYTMADPQKTLILDPNDMKNLSVETTNDIQSTNVLMNIIQKQTLSPSCIETIFIPVIIGGYETKEREKVISHYTLHVMKPKEALIIRYDSLQNNAQELEDRNHQVEVNGKSTTVKITCAKAAFRKVFNVKEEKFRYVHKSPPQQNNTTDCGAFMMYYMIRLLNNEQIPQAISEADIRNFRYNCLLWMKDMYD